MTNEMHSFSGRNSSISRKEKDNLQGGIKIFNHFTANRLRFLTLCVKDIFNLKIESLNIIKRPVMHYTTSGPDIESISNFSDLYFTSYNQYFVFQ